MPSLQKVKKKKKIFLKLLQFSRRDSRYVSDCNTNQINAARELKRYVLALLIFKGGRDYGHFRDSKVFVIGKATGKMDLKR